MKRISIPCLVLLACIVLAGCGKKNAQQPSAVLEGGLTVKENMALLDWLKKGKSVECRVVAQAGEQTIKSKGGAVRMEGVPYYSPDSDGSEPLAKNGVMLSTGDWVYTWDMQTKKGTKMNVKKMAELAPAQKEAAEDQPIAGRDNDWEKQISDMEAEDVAYDCEETNLDDALFQEPADVEFVDWTELLTNLENSMDDLPVSLPQPPTADLQGGTSDIPAVLNQEDIEKILEEQNINPADFPQE